MTTPPLPTLVFFHGLGDSHHTWEPVTRLLHAGNLDLRTPTLPGHDGSTAAGAPTLTTLHHWARTQCARVRGEFILAGHSLGGVVATLLAHDEPSGLLGVINIEGNLTDADCFLSRQMASTSDFAGWRRHELVRLRCPARRR